MTVEWKDIPGFPGYQASSHGEIRRSAPGVKTYVGRILRKRLHPSGYYQIGLTVSGKQKMARVHRLVALAFHGIPTNSTAHVLHWNNDRADNRPCNLRWGSASDNQQDRRHQGTWHENESHPGSRLTDVQVENLRADVACGDSYSVAAKRYGISRSHVWSIVSGRKRRRGDDVVVTDYDAALAYAVNDARVRRLVDRLVAEAIARGATNIPGVTTRTEERAA